MGGVSRVYENVLGCLWVCDVIEAALPRVRAILDMSLFCVCLSFRKKSVICACIPFVV